MAHNLRRSLANPLQARLAGAIVKGQHQQNPPAACVGNLLSGFGRGLTMRLKSENETQGQRDTGGPHPGYAQ